MERRFDTFLYFSAKTWQHSSPAPAELGLLSVSKGGISTFGNMAGKRDKMRLEDTKAANYRTQEEPEVGTSIAKSVVG